MMHARSLLAVSPPKTIDRRRVVRIVGELDMVTAPYLLRTLRPTIHAPGAETVMLDLAGLRFLDAAGLRALIQLAQFAQSHHRRFLATNAYGEVDTVLRLTGVDNLLGMPQIPPDDADSTDSPVPKRR